MALKEKINMWMKINDRLTVMETFPSKKKQQTKRDGQNGKCSKLRKAERLKHESIASHTIQIHDRACHHRNTGNKSKQRIYLPHSNKAVSNKQYLHT